MIVFEMFLLFTNVATYPSTGGRCKGSQVCLPREENAQSRHQHFFMENVEKTEMCGLRTLIMKGSRVVFTHGEGISTPRVHHKRQLPSIKCANMTSKLRIFPFLMFLCIFYLFVVDKGVSLAPTYFSICDEEIRPT